MLPESFDGFRLELDPERQRADVILDRRPLNIVTMTEREQLRAVLEQLDADARIRVVLLRAAVQRRRDKRAAKRLLRIASAARSAVQ
jgi:hypothetical protein